MTWPDGQVERFEAEARTGSTLLLRQGTGRAQILTLGRASLPDPLTRTETIARALKIAIGQPMPELPLKTLDGEATSLGKQLRTRRRTLLNLWATWCAPCAREMPELERLRPQLAARGIDLIGVNVDTDPAAKLRQFLEESGVRYPVFVGSGVAIEQLYAGDELLVPLSILLDEKGNVAELIPGWSDESRRRFSELAGTQTRTPK